MRGKTSCVSCQLLWGGWRSCGSCCLMTTGAPQSAALLLLSNQTACRQGQPAIMSQSDAMTREK